MKVVYEEALEKRGKRNIVKRKWKKASAILLAFNICLGKINIEVFAQSNVADLQVVQSASVSANEAENGIGWDGITKESVYEEDNFKIGV